MARGLLEQLAKHDVPAVPLDLNRAVHTRLNRALLVTHLVDFVLGAAPDLLRNLLGAVWHLVGVTWTGRLEGDRKKQANDAGDVNSEN